MPAALRIEIFPSDLQRMIDFYRNVLQFTLLKHEGTYAYLQRDSIFFGAIETSTTETSGDMTCRQPPKGVELVIEVDDLVKERSAIVGRGWKLEVDIKLQPWGLEDFRLIDPDGYYIRITTHSPGRDGTGVQVQSR
jgi:lactoylglutathione lyase